MCTGIKHIPPHILSLQRVSKLVQMISLKNSMWEFVGTAQAWISRDGDFENDNLRNEMGFSASQPVKFFSRLNLMFLDTLVP